MFAVVLWLPVILAVQIQPAVSSGVDFHDTSIETGSGDDAEAELEPSSPTNNSLGENMSHYLKLHNLTSLDDTFWKDNENLTVIDASHNPLERINILNSQYIQHINLSFTEMRWLRKGSLLGLQNLQSLDISYNKHLTTLDLFSKSLKTVDATHCSISDFSIESENVRKIDFSHNRIEKISANSLGANSSLLEFLDLSYNHIKELEEYAFLRSTTLTFLNLSNNLIQTIEWTITLSKSAKFLNLAFNRIESIELLLLKEATALNVSSNLLQELPQDLDRLLPKLSDLDASTNPIREITALDAPNLTKLNLRECKLRDISKGTFSKAQRIQHLDLRDNKLSNLDFVTSLSNVTSVLLDDNPWRCYCNISLKIQAICRPENLTLAEFCAVLVETSSLDDRWFRELMNPAIWAPILLAMVIVVVALIGFGIWKKKRQVILMRHSYESVPIDLIQNVPEEEVTNQTFRLFRAWMSWQRDRLSLQEMDSQSRAK